MNIHKPELKHNDIKDLIYRNNYKVKIPVLSIGKAQKIRQISMCTPRAKVRVSKYHPLLKETGIPWRNGRKDKINVGHVVVSENRKKY